MVGSAADIPPKLGTTESANTAAWGGDRHPFAGITPSETPVRLASYETPGALTFPAVTRGELPAPVQQAITAGKPIQFSVASDNAANKTEPDYFLTADGQLVRNVKATPSADGSINIQIEPKDKKDTSLRDAILHESQMQKQAANEMIRLFQKAHPGQPVPSWMTDLANAKPNLPDFAQQTAPADQPVRSVPTPIQQAASYQPPPDVGAPSSGAPSGSGAGQRYSPSDASSARDYSPVNMPNLPDMPSANADAVRGNALLTAGQQAFATEFAKKTGLDANVVGAWLLNEESGSAARNREAQGNMNWLNIGYTDGGQRGTNNAFWYNDPVKAADISAAWMKGEFSVPGFGKASSGIREIQLAAGQSPEAQLRAIHHSHWTSYGYEQMASIYNNVRQHNVQDTELAANKTTSPPKA